jgi:predicted RNA-binding protein with PUA-like domain
MSLKMAYWLLKSEPHVYSYADLERDRQTIWDGVNNNLALKHIRTMQPKDLALIYHTGDERRAMDRYLSPSPLRKSNKILILRALT